MKLVALETDPPFVVTAILPVVAPVGTVAVICMSESTVKVAEVPLKVTLLACVSPVPEIVTGVPTAPLGGVNEAIVGFTLKFCALVSVVVPVVTVTGPVRTPEGTVALRKMLPVRVTVVAWVPPNFRGEFGARCVDLDQRHGLPSIPSLGARSDDD